MNVPLKANWYDGINNLLFNKKHYDIKKHLTVKGEKHEDIWGDPIVVFDPLKNTSAPSDNFVTPNNKDKVTFSVFYKFYSLQLTNYTIRTRTEGDINLPTGWKLEGSFDEINWQLLHNTTHCQDLLKNSGNHTYECNQNGAFRYFRFTMTELNTGGNGNNPNYHFHVSKVEFFGTLISMANPFIKCTNLRNRNWFSSAFLFVLIK